MIYRIVVRPDTPEIAIKEYDLVPTIYKDSTEYDYNNIKEIVLRLDRKKVFIYDSKNDLTDLNTNMRIKTILLNSFSELPQLLLLNSIGLSDEEIHGVFNNDR